MFDEKLGELAIGFKETVRSLARVDWRTSVPVHKKMNQAIGDQIWDFCDEQEMDYWETKDKIFSYLTELTMQIESKIFSPAIPTPETKRSVWLKTE